MLSGIHFLLSMNCNYECDHCFLYCSPRASGTFTSEQLSAVFEQLDRMESVDSVYFEGGESFLYYPLLLHGLKLAAERGYRRGIVSNGYWANSAGDAELWLGPIAEIGLDNLSVSDDSLHHGEEEGIRSRRVQAAAEKLCLPAGAICLERPSLIEDVDPTAEKGAPIVGGDIRFRGRAADKLTEGLPVKVWSGFDKCPDEDLENPGRVHLDAFGNVHLCQGLSMGNIWETPLDELVRNYKVDEHPICHPLLKGGPAELARSCDFQPAAGYVDPCHLCYEVRKSLLNNYPKILAPAMVYGEKV